MKPVCLTCATLNCNEPADNGSGFRSLLLLWPFSICARDLFLPSLVTTALRIPHQCTAFIGMAALHNLCSSANVSPARSFWDTSPVTASAWMWNPDLLCSRFMCFDCSLFFICEILALISSRHWCWSATGQAPDWPPSEPPASPLSCSWD